MLFSRYISSFHNPLNRAVQQNISLIPNRLIHNAISRTFIKKTKGTNVLRTHVGIFGAMNAGKSSFMNSVTQHNTSIVDSKAGTTADTKISIMELHNLGPVKLFDTAGFDEVGGLGVKKREKTKKVILETNIVVAIVDPLRKESIDVVEEVVSIAKESKQVQRVLVVYNLFEDKIKKWEKQTNKSIKDQINSIHSNLKKISKKCTKLEIDLSRKNSSDQVLKFLGKNWYKPKSKTSLLPKWVGAKPDRESFVMLNIPMDNETPSGRLLKPQAMCQEYLIRNYVSTVAYRMDLGRARSSNSYERELEFHRFRSNLDLLKKSGKFDLLITDSQAIDIVHPWTLNKQNEEIVPITTFSIVMANYFSGGNLGVFIEGLERFKKLRNGDKVLITEACNHDRSKNEKLCLDIGTHQLPKKINKVFGEGNINIDFLFGRDFPHPSKIPDVDLIIHCGGCLISPQQMQGRIDVLKKMNVPIVNYGILLSYLKSNHALERVLKPWKKQLI
ncbi:atp/gtp-binding protein-related [Anaeramoeba flamelloides]|uniref:Atp/gtp-binding protein-related n=1 Tax=Anaeramoeba flamelloides TaxID=1746091 RepID=A0AAV7Y0F6_9EUKA|nr:atp/gtp-binding protein-related [Anaeramoeba flamelloides]KAJ6229517.1 atp/gtp-binding protein-related [Anaeramoeba flamelloides]